jgi:hypothetical protein
MSHHAIERARFRFGLRLDYLDIEEIKRIAAEDPRSSMELLPTSNGQRLVAVRYLGHWLPVVFAEDGKVPTILERRTLDGVRDMLDARDRQLARMGRRPSSASA